MKYCMDCRFFRGNLTAEEHEFLVKLLRSYRALLILDSWVKLGQTKKPGGKVWTQKRLGRLKFSGATEIFNAYLPNHV